MTDVEWIAEEYRRVVDESGRDGIRRRDAVAEVERRYLAYKADHAEVAS